MIQRDARISAGARRYFFFPSAPPAEPDSTELVFNFGTIPIALRFPITSFVHNVKNISVYPPGKSLIFSTKTIDYRLTQGKILVILLPHNFLDTNGG